MAKERTGLIGALAQQFSLQRPPMGMTPRGMDLWMEREVRRLLSEGKCRWTLIARANQPYKAVVIRRKSRKVAYGEKVWAALARGLLEVYAQEQGRTATGGKEVGNPG